MFRKCILFFAVLLFCAWAQGQSDKGQKKPDSDPALDGVASTGLNQNVVPASELSNNELLARSRSIYVASDTVFVKKEDMEKYLLRQKELDEFRLHVVQKREDADLILQIKRIPFTNNFPYSITDRASSIVIMQGEISGLGSKVPGQIAAVLADKLREANGKKTESQQAPAK